MEETSKRLSIYVPYELSQRLTAVRLHQYQNKSQADMLRDLIARGLQESERQTSDLR